MPAVLPLMLIVLGLSAGTMAAANARVDQEESHMPTSHNLSLPAPARDGTVSLERALQDRRTQRVFGTQPLTLADVSQLLWAMQGRTASDGAVARHFPPACCIR